jgi:hypothetical protein
VGAFGRSTSRQEVLTLVGTQRTACADYPTLPGPPRTVIVGVPGG